MLLHSSESLHLCLVLICTSSPLLVSEKSLNNSRSKHRAAERENWGDWHLAGDADFVLTENAN